MKKRSLVALALVSAASLSCKMRHQQGESSAIKSVELSAVAPLLCLPNGGHNVVTSVAIEGNSHVRVRGVTPTPYSILVRVIDDYGNHVTYNNGAIRNESILAVGDGSENTIFFDGQNDLRSTLEQSTFQLSVNFVTPLADGSFDATFTAKRNRYFIYGASVKMTCSGPPSRTR